MESVDMRMAISSEIVGMQSDLDEIRWVQDGFPASEEGDWRVEQCVEELEGRVLRLKRILGL